MSLLGKPFSFKHRRTAKYRKLQVKSQGQGQGQGQVNRKKRVMVQNPKRGIKDWVFTALAEMQKKI